MVIFGNLSYLREGFLQERVERGTRRLEDSAVCMRLCMAVPLGLTLAFGQG